MHDLLAGPVVNALLIDGADSIAVAKPRAMTRRAWSCGEDIYAIVSFRDSNAYAVDSAALLSLNLVEFGLGEER